MDSLARVSSCYQLRYNQQQHFSCNNSYNAFKGDLCRSVLLK